MHTFIQNILRLFKSHKICLSNFFESHNLRLYMQTSKHKRLHLRRQVTDIVLLSVPDRSYWSPCTRRCPIWTLFWLPWRAKSRCWKRYSAPCLATWMVSHSCGPVVSQRRILTTRHLRVIKDCAHLDSWGADERQWHDGTMTAVRFPLRSIPWCGIQLSSWLSN